MEIIKEKVKGFDKGYQELTNKMRQFKEDLRRALDVKTDIQVSQYRHGKNKMNYPRILAVRDVFIRYGIDEPFDMAEG